MKSSLVTAAAIFASTTLAVKYAAGTNCHSNLECEANCIDKQYTVASENGGFIFACDSSVADPLDWYTLMCGSGSDAATTAACAKIGGVECSPSCVLTGKRSVDEDNRKKWAASCDRGYAEIIVCKDEKEAREWC